MALTPTTLEVGVTFSNAAEVSKDIEQQIIVINATISCFMLCFHYTR